MGAGHTAPLDVGLQAGDIRVTRVRTRSNNADNILAQAVKEFSKSRLRKRAQSNYLRRPSVRKRGIGKGLNSPLHRQGSDQAKPEDALQLIREEIAIMKKLNHPNLVSLIEVLDDPDEDSLYMVMEMCKKGVSMKVGLEDRADPYEEEWCRCWFRDMILGIEYRTCRRCRTSASD